MDVFDPNEFSPEVREHYLKAREKIGEDDPYASLHTMGIHEVLLAHYLIADFFVFEGEGMGGVGVKDYNLLHSALYRQHVSLKGSPKWDSIFDVCATLMFGIIQDHVFYDGNKRTAFLCALSYLERHGRTPTLSDRRFEDFLVDIATEGGLNKYARYQSLKKHLVILRLTLFLIT